MGGEKEEVEEKKTKVVEEEAAAEVKDEKGKAAPVDEADGDVGDGAGGSRGRRRSRSASRSSRSRSRGKKRGGRSRSRSDSGSRSRSRKKHRRKKHKKRKKRRRRRSSSSSSSDSEEAGWEKKFLATAMENAQKARMGASDPSGAVPGPGAGVSGNKAIGRFFDNQGRFINPAGGFNPSGAPRRIPKEHGQWGDWECEACGGHNRKHRTSCFTCFTPKPLEAKPAHYTTSVGGRKLQE